MFIDRSVAHTVIFLREHGDDLFKAMAKVLEAMDGKLIVPNMSFDGTGASNVSQIPNMKSPFSLC